jgi:hypothetical protein
MIFSGLIHYCLLDPRDWGISGWTRADYHLRAKNTAESYPSGAHGTLLPCDAQRP